ncbi:MAG: hypothetical protein N3C60_06000 [Calditerrivibrio sp.]|nr:hypothetical protein [Calditerrivibrio sp.]
MKILIATPSNIAKNQENFKLLNNYYETYIEEMKKFLIIISCMLLLDFAHAMEIEQYKCIEIKTEIINIKYSVKKENTAEFILKGNTIENLKINIGNLKLTYRQSKKLVEEGRDEKKDLFVVECYEPFFDDELYIYKVNPIEFNRHLKERERMYHLSRISPVITPQHPFYPTLKKVSKKLNMKIPHRTFVILNTYGDLTHEFFCYLDKNPKMPKKK